MSEQTYQAHVTVMRGDRPLVHTDPPCEACRVLGTGPYAAPKDEASKPLKDDQQRELEEAAHYAVVIEAPRRGMLTHKTPTAKPAASPRLFTRDEVFFCAGAAAMAAREGQDLVAAVNRAIAHLDGTK